MHRAAALLVIALLFPAGVSAQVEPLATFTSSVRISAAGQDAFQARVAVDASGDAVFMWLRSDGTNNRAEARGRSASGTFSSIQVLSAAGQPAWMHDLAINENGDAIFAWVRSDGTNQRVQIRTRSAAGTFSSVQTVSPAGFDAHWPAVAIDAGGNALVAWQGHDGTFFRVRARTRSAGGSLGPMQTLSPAGEAGWSPRIAMEPTGRAIVTWYRLDTDSNYRVQMRERDAAGTWSAVQTISELGVSAQNPQIALMPNGAAMFVWTRGGTNILVQARKRSVNGQLGNVQTLSEPGQNALGARLAVDGSGTTIFTWYRSDGTDLRVQARTRSSTGTLSAVQTLSPAGADSSYPNVAVDPNGNAIVVWERFNGTTGYAQARVRAPDGTLGSVRTLGSAPEDGLRPVVAVDPDGRAAIAWAGHDGADWRIFTARATLP